MKRSKITISSFCLCIFLVGCGGAEDTAEANSVLRASESATVSEAKSINLTPIAIPTEWYSAELKKIQTKAASSVDAKVYRFYSTNTSAHFYTISPLERNSVMGSNGSLNYEGAGYAASMTPGTGLLPVYRFFNRATGTHFYTISEAEKNNVLASLSSVYQLEGVAWYAPAAASINWLPNYRFYNKNSGTHFYTANESEKSQIIQGNKSLSYEGVAYYVKSATAVPPVSRWLGTREALAGTHVEVVVFGEEANTVASVSLEGKGCAQSLALSSITSITFSCPTPGYEFGDQARNVIPQVVYKNGRVSTAPGIYLSSKDYWLRYNGQFWDNGPTQYVFRRNTDNTISVSMSITTFAGNDNDLPDWKYFSGVVIQGGAEQSVRCLPSDEAVWTYKCPAISTGPKVVFFERELGRVWMVGSSHAIFVTDALVELTPLPVQPVPTTPAIPDLTPPPTVNCDPNTDKSCI